MNQEIEPTSDFEDDLEAPPELPPANFDFLVYSLRLQAELNLGILPFGGAEDDNAEDDEEQGPDLELARHNIDLLAMLQEKTKGNLTVEEQMALDNSVAELRMRFVQTQSEAS